MSNIEERIKSLEKVNRRWRYMAGLLACLLIIILTLGAKQSDSIPEVLQANRIEILRPDGEPGIVLSADDNRSAIGLTAEGQDHKRIISLMAHREGAELVLMKHAEAPLFIARVDDNGSLLSLIDGREPSQKPGSIVLRSTSPVEDSPGGSMITMSKGPRNKDMLAGLLAIENGDSPSLFLGPGEGKSMNINVNQENGKLDFLGENGKSIWTMP